MDHVFKITSPSPPSLPPSLSLSQFVAGGLHLRAGLVVWLLTQWSLFVGWGSYMNIGAVETNNSRFVIQ